LNKSLIGVRIASKVGEAIIEAVDEDIDFESDCLQCGYELDVLDSNGEALDPPNYYCENCGEVKQRAIREADKEAMAKGEDQ